MKCTKFLERYKLLELTQTKVDNLNSLKLSKRIKSIIFKKHQAQIVSLMNSTKHLRKNDNNSLQSLLEKIKAEGTLPNSFYVTSIILITKANKTLQERTTKLGVVVHSCNPAIWEVEARGS
jgi:tRNA G37 N-methylase Trm5